MNLAVKEIHDRPQHGDVIELVEYEGTGDSEHRTENMLRVVAVQEDHVWFKQYGLGYKIVSLKAWRHRITMAHSASVYVSESPV